MNLLFQNIHFIGISGISMSAIAIFIRNNYPHIKITGTTDLKDFTLDGIEINGTIDHLHQDRSMVIYTSCLGNEHEMLKNNFINSGIKTIHRMDLINILTHGAKRILVTGAHGKTSTCSYMYNLLKEQHYGYFIGGLLENNEGALKDTNYIIEGDESDKSFTSMTGVEYVIITNISNDHMENYNDSFDEYLYTFESYLFHCKGTLIYNKNTCNALDSLVKIQESSNAYMLQQIVERSKIKNISYGYEKSDVNIKIMEDTHYLKWQLETNHPLLSRLNEQIFTVDNIYGQWNIYNITAALIVAHLENIQIPSSIPLIKPQRRMEEIYKDNGKLIIDDYGVHPTELANIIHLCEKKYGKNKVTYLWQPHRPSRLLNLHREFATVLEPLGKKLFYTDIYNASEDNIIPKSSIYDYINYGKYIGEDELESMIKNSKHSIIVLLNAGSLSCKVKKIIQKMKDQK